MKVADAVQEMTKSYLHRIIDSFTRDFPKPDEDKSREIILRNVEELTDSGRIRRVLDFADPFDVQVLVSYIFEALVNRSDFAAAEGDIIEEVTALEQRVLDAAMDPASLRYEDSQAVEIMTAVLEVALEDEKVSDSELKLLRRLREKIGLSEAGERIIMAKLGHFPRSGNLIHSPSSFRDALIELQRRGLVFYCNKLDGGKFVIPEEIVSEVRRALGIELSRQAYGKLLEVLTKDHLSNILESRKLPKSGRKEELQTRIERAGIKPSEALQVLSNQDLYQILSALPGAAVSGSKVERVDRIIDYFANLVVRDVRSEASPREKYYEYLTELAARDRESLLTNRVIKKDKDMDSAFEEGTCYLFTEKLGIALEDMPGSDHCDGCMRFGKNGDLFMWDNKSKESVYDFPPSHMRQFKRYIRDSPDRVSCFLVIVPEVGPGAAQNAARLKVESGTDTDVALITAADLVWVAEEWSERRGAGAFNLDVFNITGTLTRLVLEQRMKLFAR
jgi:hypothetical protein